MYSRIKGAVCDICGLKLDRCGCRPNRLYEKAVFPLLFEDDVRASLHRFKFRNRTDKAKPFAEAIKTALEERELLQDVDLLTFIPMGKKALHKRGYNQAQLLCEELQKATGLPMLPLFSNVYFDFYTTALHDYPVSENVSWAQAIVGATLYDEPEEE